MLKRNRNKVLSLESLETRQVMAGNVLADLTNGQLKIEGDSLDNDIRIAQTATAVTVTGRNGTLVNGFASRTFPAANLLSAEIKMNAGNDVVAIARLQTSADQVIELGDGNDRVNLSGDVSGTLVAVIGGQGNDTVNGTNLTSSGDLTLQLEDGVGRVNLNNASVLKKLSISTADAADAIFANGLTVGEDLFIETKLGNDNVNLSNVSIGRGMELFTDHGNDAVTLNNLRAQNAAITSGDGNDTVNLIAVATDQNFTLATEGGIDNVSAQVTAGQDVSLDGGGDFDTLTDNGIVGLVSTSINEFEVVL